VFFIEFAFVVAFALAIAVLFVMVVGRAPRTRGSSALPFVWLFVILVFTMWAGGLWIGPAGPLIFGVAWLPFLVVGLVVALIVAAATESTQRRDTAFASGRGDVSPLLAAFSVASLVLLVALVIAVAVAYLR
jgi:hypothetical protein